MLKSFFRLPWKVQLFFVAALPITILVILNAIGSITISDGDRFGTVAKLSYKGLPFCKTWEGELALDTGVSVSGTLPFATIWVFSVAKDGPLKELEEASRNRRRIRVRYKQRMWQKLPLNPWQLKSDYKVVQVEML